MPHLAAWLAMSQLMGHDRDAAERRHADEWRALHRRPDALPDPVEPVPAFRRWRVSGSIVRLRRSPATGA
jgi:hypothetical protein